MGGALFVWGVIVRMSPDSACTKNTMANIVASQKIDPTDALDLFIILFLLLRASVPGFSFTSRPNRCRRSAIRCYGDVARAAPKKASRIYRKRESQIRVPQPRSAFHLHAQQTLSVVTMWVCNPDCSPFKVQR
jgi:hypothetical protein